MFAVPSWQSDSNNDFTNIKKKKNKKKVSKSMLNGKIKNISPKKVIKPKNKPNLKAVKQIKSKLTTKLLNSCDEISKMTLNRKSNKRKKLLKSESNNEGKYVKFYPDELDNNDKEVVDNEKKMLTEKKDNIVKTKTSLKDKKKEKMKQILQNNSFNRNVVKSNGQKLRERMMDKLKAAQFRFLNEKLYTSKGSEAQELFNNDPEAFNTYHEGYQQQLKKWPVNPLDIIVKKISKMPKTTQIADLGCGEGALSRKVPQPVRSFDLVAHNPSVEQCDMSRTPLLSASVGVAVYCLSLMGTELTRYLVEANRILKTGGLLMIAEVESRFADVDAFVKDVRRLGFKLTKLDKTHEVFFFLEFKKINEAPVKKNKLPYISLKPCLYKRR